MSRSKQSLGSYHLTTCNLGELIPIGMLPVLPGDIIGQKTDVLMRLSPLAAPVMHQVDVRVHHFNVAYRTLWDDNDGTDWEEFITGGEDGMNTDTVPQMTSTGVAKDLLDHFGIPPISGISISSLPVKAFNFCFNEFYRDQDLVAKRTPEQTDIPKIAWEKDYFTTARPWAAKGPAVSIPLGDTAPVVRTANAVAAQAYVSGSETLAAAGSMDVTAGSLVEGNAEQLSLDPRGGLEADLKNATGADPLDVRRAWGIQRFMENAGRYGSRYPEKMRQLGSLYKGLMDRPEFLAGGHKAVNFSEVLQTANDVGDRAFGVGDMYGHGIAAMRSNQYARRIDEHGVILSLLSVRPKAMYQNGIHREWLRQDREDFHDPYLEFIGQQEVWLNEIWAAAGQSNIDVFGYSDKYQEYRGQPSGVSAEFRDILDYWHLGRQFTVKPLLNEVFVECNPSKRIFNEQTQDSLWIMANHKIAGHRNVSKSATPRLI